MTCFLSVWLQALMLLGEAFPEQKCTVLVPSHPSKGLRISAADLRARISESSTFLQRTRADPAVTVLAMGITQLPSGAPDLVIQVTATM